MRVLIIAGLIALAGCSKNTTEIAPPLEAMGMTNVRAEGWAMWGCGDDNDTVYQTRFTAKGANGTPVKGVVCQGWFKGQTVRFD